MVGEEGEAPRADGAARNHIESRIPNPESRDRPP